MQRAEAAAREGGRDFDERVTDPSPFAAERDRYRPSPELIAVAVLLLATAAFGRTFSKLAIGFDWLHPTEIVLGLALAVCLVGAGPRRLVDRLREMGALVPLLVLWLFGAIATVRGLRDWGFDLVLHDIGLVEYSLLIPLLALAVRDRRDLEWLCRVIALGGALAIAVFATTVWTPPSWGIGAELALIMVASGMFVGLYAAWVAARFAAGVRVPYWHYPLVALGIAFIAYGAARAAWLALAAAFVVVVLFAPARRRILSAAVLAAVLAVGFAGSVPVEELVWRGEAPTEEEETEGSGSEVGTGVVGEIEASFASTSTAQAANSQWRLAFWKFAIEETARTPVLGIGFGTPAAFVWEGIPYDSRTGDPLDPFDVTGPHNSFVNLLYRTGVFGLLALAALMAIAVFRLVPVARGLTGRYKAVSIWLLAALALTTVITALSVALEGPFIGIFFWTVLAMSLLAPGMLAGEGSSKGRVKGEEEA